MNKSFHIPLLAKSKDAGYFYVINRALNMRHKSMESDGSMMAMTKMTTITSISWDQHAVVMLNTLSPNTLYHNNSRRQVFLACFRAEIKWIKLPSSVTVITKWLSQSLNSVFFALGVLLSSNSLVLQAFCYNVNTLCFICFMYSILGLPRSIFKIVIFKTQSNSRFEHHTNLWSRKS